MEPSDEELVLRFQGGDGTAFEAMVTRWNEPILQLATRLTGDLEEAKDVRQMAAGASTDPTVTTDKTVTALRRLTMLRLHLLQGRLQTNRPGSSRR
jgi:hypothetical protein